VNDIEVIDTKAPCPQRIFCCAPGMDYIEIHTIDKNGKVVLKVKEGDGEKISNPASMYLSAKHHSKLHFFKYYL
jgi:hypothetical protein